MIKYLDNVDEFTNEIKKERRVVDFYADWCGPCKMLGRVLEDMDADVLKVNVDSYPEIAKEYGIMTIPSVLIFENGNVINKHIGFMTKEEFSEFIK